MNPTPWTIQETQFGESMGYDGKSAIFDANGKHLFTTGKGANDQVYEAESIAQKIIDAVNDAA